MRLNFRGGAICSILSVACLNDRAQVRKSGRSYVCTTQDLVALNLKHKEAEQECLRITEKILEDLANFVKSRVIYLVQFSEALALLDVVVKPSRSDESLFGFSRWKADKCVRWFFSLLSSR